MPRRSRRPDPRPRHRAASRPGLRVPEFLAGSATRLGRGVRRLRRAPGFVQLTFAAATVLALSFAVNWTYQVARKPSELLFPFDGTLHKTPEQTWRAYEPLFRKHSTSVSTPELLAALAQVEAMGNPIARTYWRWSWSHRPFEIYRPASSSVGMYQMTDGTFAQARRLCIRDHAVLEAGPWHAPQSCWFNRLYTRVIPSHAIELASANLDREVARILARHPHRIVAGEQKQRLAAVIHLCGAGAGARYASGSFPAGGRCGSHDLDAYLARVDSMVRHFARLAAVSDER